MQYVEALRQLKENRTTYGAVPNYEGQIANINIRNHKKKEKIWFLLTNFN